MKLLVVGASGLIGNAVYHIAKNQDIDVIGTATTSHDGKYIPYNLAESDPNELLKTLGIYGKQKNTFAVIAAAIANIQQCYDDEKNAFNVNVTGTCKLAEIFASCNIRSIFLSSDAVFDGISGNYAENDEPSPICIYGEQKVQTEDYLLANIPNILIYRLSKQVVTSLTIGLLGDIYRQYKNLGYVRCIKGLIFNPTYIYDTASCILKGLLEGLTGLFHVSNSEIFSRYEISKLFFDKINVSTDICEDDISRFLLKEHKPLNTTMSTHKFQSVLPYKFKTVESIIDEIAMTI